MTIFTTDVVHCILYIPQDSKPDQSLLEIFCCISKLSFVFFHVIERINVFRGAIFSCCVGRIPHNYQLLQYVFICLVNMEIQRNSDQYRNSPKL